MTDAITDASMLNLTVIAQSEQPSDPKENTIWIKSDISVQSVYITSIQPSIDTLNIGDAWINTGSGYNINGLPNANDNMLVIKDNPYLQIVVGTVKQYIGDDGVWSRPDVQIYKNGEWHSEVLYIYSQGVWSEYGKFLSSIRRNLYDGSDNILGCNNTKTFKMTEESDETGTFLHCKGLNGYGTVLVTSEDIKKNYWSFIDVTKYNTISVIDKTTSSHGNTYTSDFNLLLVAKPTDAYTPDSTTGFYAPKKAKLSLITPTSTGGLYATDIVTRTLDISSISGECAPVIYGNVAATNPYVNIYEIALIV